MNNSMIEVRALDKSFKTVGGDVDVLKGIDVDIQTGERVAIVGTSGAGKTTLMHILGGLDQPSRGAVLFEGQDIFNFNAVALDLFRNRTVGFVFQFHQLLPEFTALENVMMPLFIGGVKRQDAVRQATKFLDEVGLSHRLSHKPGALSGGEQQRVAIARALVRSPRILLADEPTGNLDSGTSDEILDLLNRLHSDYGLTMIVVTHNSQLAGSLDRVLELKDGFLATDNLN